jgi:acetate---CoA ligase (ADP-forming)
VLYLESVGNPRNFARVTRDTALIKPIVAVKSGRSAAGTRVASSHSAALANRDVAVDALFAQAGVIRTDTLEALFDVVAILSTQPLPMGPRVGVIGNAGGPAVLFTDACDAQGLTLAELHPATIAELRSRLNINSALANPVDMTASASLRDFEYAIAIVGSDPNVDSVVAIYIPPVAGQAAEAAAAIARGAAQVPATKPVLAVSQFAGILGAGLDSSRGTIPIYAFPENPAIALGAAWRYARWRSRPRGSVSALSRFGRDTIRAVVERALTQAGDAWTLSREEIATVLRAAAISVAQTEDPANPAERLPAPRESASRIVMFAGVTMDPTFGPLIACGFGSPPGEMVFRLHPVTDVDAAEVISWLSARELFHGSRDTRPGDGEVMVDLLMRVSALVEAIPEMAELELYPISVHPPGKGAIVLDARMRLEALSARRG